MPRFFKTIDDLLSPAECKQIIEKYENKLVVMKRDFDTNEVIYARCTFNDPFLAEKLGQRIGYLLPTTYNNKFLVKFLDDIRFAKTTVGGEFPIHRDGVGNYDGVTTGPLTNVLTLNIFLSKPEDQSGGTDFVLCDSVSLPIGSEEDWKKVSTTVEPKIGRGVLFDPNIIHRGNKVLGETKYVLRLYVLAR